MVFSWECSFESFARKRQKRTEAKFWQTKSQKYVLETFHHSCFSLLWKVCGVSLHPCDITHALESVQDFLIKLDMKPCMHQEEISIFSLNHVILRPTKIMNNLLKYLTRRSTFINEIFWKLWILKFSKNVPNFCQLCS